MKSCLITIDPNRTTAASKVDTSLCVGSSAHDRLIGSVEGTMNCETSCGPAPVPTNMFLLTTAGSSSPPHCDRNGHAGSRLTERDCRPELSYTYRREF
jgi:hypothetical protein